MAKQTNYIGLPPETLLDIVAIRKTESEIESITVVEMSVRDWQNIKKKPGFQYICYQKGFSQFNTKPK